MSNEVHNEYVRNLRGNKDVFLADIKRSPEFKEIEQRHLKNVFMGIYSLLKRVDGNDESARKVHKCAAEVSDTFNIKTETAIQLLLTPEAPALYGMKYIPPRVSRGRRGCFASASQNDQERSRCYLETRKRASGGHRRY